MVVFSLFPDFVIAYPKNPFFCFIDKIFDLIFIISNTNCGKFFHLATDFLNNNNSDIAGTMSFLSDKHS